MKDEDIILKDIPYVKDAHTPSNEKQQNYLLNMSQMTRGERDMILGILDYYIEL